MEGTECCGGQTGSLQDWLSEITKELRAETYAKSRAYGFDFETGRALHGVDTSYFWRETELPKAEEPLSTSRSALSESLGLTKKP